MLSSERPITARQKPPHTDPVDKTGPITLPGVLIGIVVGIGVGWLWATFRRAWRDVGSARELGAERSKAAWARSGELLLFGFLLAVVVAFALGHR